MLCTPGGIDEFPEDSFRSAQFLVGRWIPLLREFSETAKNLSPNYLYEHNRNLTPAFSVPVTWTGFPGHIDSWLFGEEGAENLANQSAELPRVIFGRHRSGHGLTFGIEDGIHFHRPLYRISAGQDGRRRNSAVSPLCRQQDEYLEWHVSRNDAGRPDRITLTTEPQEYWQKLYEFAPERVLTIYREAFDNPHIQAEDLEWPHDVFAESINAKGELFYKAGDYNPYNRWNVEQGAMHLTHPVNRLLGQFLLLGAAASIKVPPPHGLGLASIGRQLIAETGNGSGINRISDPRLVSTIHALTQQGHRLSLFCNIERPVGVYIRSIDTANVYCPDQPGSRLRVRYPRGEPGHAVRAVIEPAPPMQFLDQYEIDGQPITTGSMIARITHLALDVDVFLQREGTVVRHPDRGRFEAADPVGLTSYSSERDRHFWKRRRPLIAGRE